MAGKHVLAAALGLASLFSASAFAERPPNFYTQADIEEYRQVCLQQRQDYARGLSQQNGTSSDPSYADVAPNQFYNAQGQFLQGQGVLQALFENNTLDADTLERNPENLDTWPSGHALRGCARRIRAAQLRRPLPQANRPAEAAAASQSSEARQRDSDSTNQSPEREQQRRRRGALPQVTMGDVSHVGETRCMRAVPLGTRWHDPDNESDTRMFTRVQILSTCPREQVFEVALEPTFEMGLSAHWFDRAIPLGVAGWARWCGFGMHRNSGGGYSCIFPYPEDWRPAVVGAHGHRLVRGSVHYIEVLQDSENWHPIRAQIASCDATRDGPNGPQVKVMMLQDNGGEEGFVRAECPVVPEDALTDRDRANLASIFNIPRPPPNEHPQMTRCMNRDGSLDSPTAEASCRALATASDTPDNLRRYALYNWARARLIAGDFAEAIDIGNRALSLRPSANAHHNLGLAHMRRRDYAAAAGHLQAALRLNPENRNSRYLLNRVNLLIDNPSLEQSWEAVEARGRLQMAGMARIDTERARCATEAAALGTATSEGKAVAMTAPKLDRLAAAVVAGAPESRSQAAEGLRNADRGLSEFAQAYMICLLDSPPVQTRSAASANAAGSPGYVPRNSCNPEYEAYLGTVVNADEREGRVRYMRDTWRTWPRGQFDRETSARELRQAHQHHPDGPVEYLRHPNEVELWWLYILCLHDMHQTRPGSVQAQLNGP